MLSILVYKELPVFFKSYSFLLWEWIPLCFYCILGGWLDQRTRGDDNDLQ
uniref:Uncharacterized protein n=1 Tax=Arundo donax TaxID=35708 RepID=A0A0A9DQE9_ARUDO